MKPDAVALAITTNLGVNADQHGLVAVGRYRDIGQVVNIGIDQAELVPSVSVVEGHRPGTLFIVVCA